MCARIHVHVSVRVVVRSSRNVVIVVRHSTRIDVVIIVRHRARVDVVVIDRLGTGVDVVVRIRVAVGRVGINSRRRS